MKFHFTSFIVFLLLCSSAFAQQTSWQPVSPIPQGNALGALSVVDANNVFACGASGTFMSSTNGGETWFVDTYLNGILEQFFGIHFVTSQLGWMCGESGRIMRTTDGGRHWTEQPSKVSRDLFSIYFASSTVGWACGTSGVIVKTTNAGASWVPQTSNTTATLFGIQFTSTAIGWAVGAGGKILKTTDGGTTWNTQNANTTAPLYSLSFATASVGWVAGGNGNIYKTTNGGTNWEYQPNEAGVTLSGIHMVSSTIGWAAGSFGTVVKTTDGGTSWPLQLVDTYKDFFAIRFANATTGWAIGDYGTIFKTTNAGTSWIRKSGVTRTDLYSSYFPTTKTGYTVGEEGTVLKTTDGGYTWANKDVNFYLPMWGVHFLNENTGWVVGDSSLILKTVNGGDLWSKQATNLPVDDPEPLYSVFFLDQFKGWVSGEFGILLRTVNGGGMWTAESTGVFSALLKVKFANANVGWAVGWDGTILKSTDGGDNWVQQESGTFQTLYSIEILNQNTAYVCGDFGLILYTKDGGANWQTIPADDVVESFYDLTTFGSQNIWLVGDDGLIYGTTNGGSSWARQNSGTINTLLSIQAIPSGSGALIMASGYGNTVVKSALSPLSSRRWAGTIDSAWTTAGNWTPSGVPDMYDSVYIPNVSRRPALRHSAQRVNIAALNIGSGGSMFIGSGISEFIVSGNVVVSGKLEIESNTRSDFTVGGGFINNGTFTQSNTTLFLNGQGELKGTFSDVAIAEFSNLSTAGNVTITNSLNLNSTLGIGATDTLTISTTDTVAIYGLGIIEGGTIKRAIASNSTAAYRFGMPVTTVQFLPGSVTPTDVLLTSFPNTLSPEMPDSIYVKRYYVGKTIGGGAFKARVYLGFTSDETSLFADEVAFYKDSSNLLINMGNFDYIDADYMASGLDSVSKFTTWYLGDISYLPKHSLEFLGSLYVADNTPLGDTLKFGTFRSATANLDIELGEIQLPAIPAIGTFDARMTLAGNIGTKIDFRPLTEGANHENIFTCSFQPGAGGYPIQLSWNFESKGWGTVYLRDAGTLGSKLNVNMKAQSSVTITDTTIKSIQIVQKEPIYISVLKNWNIVSVPHNPSTSARKSYMFPTALSNAFGFSNGYYAADTMKNGPSYWLKFYHEQPIGLEGTSRLIDTFKVNAGWNMIGSISAPIATNKITQIPAGMIPGFFYGYNNGYTIVDTIKPGRGYWVKANVSGRLALVSAGLEKIAGDAPQMPVWETMSSLTIRDNEQHSQVLYFGDEAKLNVPLSAMELPPNPPQEIFDARFSSNRIFEPLTNRETETYTVSLQSARYPVTLSCESGAQAIQSIKVTDAKTGLLLGILTPGGSSSLAVDNPAVTQLRLTVKSGGTLPVAFALEQNYPNPFNPATTIQFSLPEAASVTIEVFNVLGQQVATLIEREAFEGGTHAVNWRAGNLSSGVYFYRMIARNQQSSTILFQQVKKLMLLK